MLDNPMLVSMLAMFLRQGVLLLVGALGLEQVVKPIIDQYATEFQQTLAAVAAGIVVMGYAAFKKFHDRQKLVTAAQMAGTTEATIEKMVSSSVVQTPSVTTPKTEVPSSSTGGTVPGGAGKFVFALLCVGLLSSVACAKGAHVAAQVENVAHDGLMAFDRGLDSRCDAGQLTAETCKQLNTLLVRVWDIKNSLNRSILDNTTVLIPSRVADFRKAVSDLIALVNQLVAGGAKELLVRELNLSLTQIQ